MLTLMNVCDISAILPRPERRGLSHFLVMKLEGSSGYYLPGVNLFLNRQVE